MVSLAILTTLLLLLCAEKDRKIEYCLEDSGISQKKSHNSYKNFVLFSLKVVIFYMESQTIRNMSFELHIRNCAFQKLPGENQSLGNSETNWALDYCISLQVYWKKTWSAQDSLIKLSLLANSEWCRNLINVEKK